MQKSDLIALRNQANVSAAVSALIATIFAPTAIQGRADIFKCESGCVLMVDAYLFAAFMCLFLSLLLVLGIVAGYRPFTFDTTPRDFEFGIQYETLEAFQIRYGNALANLFQANEVQINAIQAMVFASLLLGCLQMPFWILFLSRSLI